MDLNNNLTVTDYVSGDHMDPAAAAALAKTITLEEALAQTAQADAAGDAPLPKEHWHHLGNSHSLVQNVLGNTCELHVSSHLSKELVQQEALSVCNGDTNMCQNDKSVKDMVIESNDKSGNDMVIESNDKSDKDMVIESVCLNDNDQVLLRSESCLKMEEACAVNSIPSDKHPVTENVTPCPSLSVDMLNDYHGSRNVLAPFSVVYQSSPAICKVGNKMPDLCFQLSPIAEERSKVDGEDNSVSAHSIKHRCLFTDADNDPNMDKENNIFSKLDKDKTYDELMQDVTSLCESIIGDPDPMPYTLQEICSSKQITDDPNSDSCYSPSSSITTLMDIAAEPPDEKVRWCATPGRSDDELLAYALKGLETPGRFHSVSSQHGSILDDGVEDDVVESTDEDDILGLDEFTIIDQENSDTADEEEEESLLQQTVIEMSVHDEPDDTMLVQNLAHEFISDELRSASTEARSPPLPISASSLLKKLEVVYESPVAASSTRTVICLDSDTEIEKSPEAILPRTVVLKQSEGNKDSLVPVPDGSSLKSNLESAVKVEHASQMNVPTVISEIQKTSEKISQHQLSAPEKSPVRNITSMKDDLRKMLSHIAQQSVKPSAIIPPFRLSPDTQDDDEDPSRIVVLSSVSNSEKIGSVQGTPSVPSATPAVRTNTTATVVRPKAVAVRPTAKGSASRAQSMTQSSATCRSSDMVASATPLPITEVTSVISHTTEESDTIENQRVCLNDDTELIRMTKERWGSEGVQCPDVNLTHAGYFRRQRKGGKVRATLEGPFILSPLIDRLTNVQKGGMKRKRNMSGGEDNERMSKRIRSDNGNSVENNPVILQYQLEELSQSTKRSLREIVRKEIEMKEFVMRRHQCQLEELEGHQKSELMLLWHGCQVPNLLRSRLAKMYLEHQAQRNRLQSIHRREVELISIDAKREICAEEQQYDRKAVELRARLNSSLQNPYTTVTLEKAPCRSSKYKHTTIQVCLPEDIAHSIMMEDVIYEAFYSFSTVP